MAISNNELVAFVQAELNARYGLNLTVDGKIGPNTLNALNRVTAVPSHFEKGKRFVAFIQYLTHVEPLVDDIAIDGYTGPATENAIHQLLAVAKTGKPDLWRDELPQPKYDWPTYRNIKSVFGEPGTRQSKVRVPYSLKLAWDLKTSISRFGCHELVVEPIQEAMEEILNVYGRDGIEELKLDYWGGCYNYRVMRGGSQPSTHSWGAAIDWLPQENRLKWNSSRASLAKPEYEDFWRAWEKVGGVSLGRVKNYDWMHVQFVKP